MNGNDTDAAVENLCHSLHEAEYVYYDATCALLFIWNGSLTVNIWNVAPGYLREVDVFMYGAVKPTLETVRSSIKERLDLLACEDNNR